VHRSISQIKHQLNVTLCRFYFWRVTLHVSGAWRPKHVERLCRNKTCTALDQVGVLFDLNLKFVEQMKSLFVA